MFLLPKKKIESTLYDQNTFYDRFIKDLDNSKKKVIIESPYITSYRMSMLYPIFIRLLTRKVSISIITRDPIQHEDEYIRNQTTNEILNCCELGIQITLLKTYHHRKLAIIDCQILWEGSLNILSQVYSQEIMRRFDDKKIVADMMNFLKK